MNFIHLITNYELNLLHRLASSLTNDATTQASLTRLVWETVVVLYDRPNSTGIFF